MQTRDIINHGGLGFFMGFYGSSTSRALGVRVESDPARAPYMWSAAFIGAVATLISGQGDFNKLIPYLLGLIIGGAAGAIVFDAMNPEYQPSGYRP